MNKKIIIGNWKMNPTGLSDAKKIFQKIAAGAGKLKGVETVICPPAVFLGLIGATKGIKLGGQDASYEQNGAFTGSISPSMIKSFGAEYVIIGHSERRQVGETDEIVNKKIKAAFKLGLKVVMCIGENIHDESGDYLTVLKHQLETGLAGIQKKNFSLLTVAHEPVWAIGVGARGADNPESFQHNRLFIKKILSGMAGKKIGLEVPVIYGGSVNVKNAGDFLLAGDADGLLVGRASLVPEDFVKIVGIASEISNKKQ